VRVYPITDIPDIEQFQWEPTDCAGEGIPAKQRIKPKTLPGGSSGRRSDKLQNAPTPSETESPKPTNLTNKGRENSPADSKET